MRVLGALAGIVGVAGIAGVFVSIPVLVFAISTGYVLENIPAAELIRYAYSSVIN